MALKHAALFLVLIFQLSCSSGGGGEPQANQNQTGSRRLVEIQTTYSNSRIDTISIVYDSHGFPESDTLVSDGEVVERTNYIIDSNGLVSYLEKDFGGDGSVDTTIQYNYSAGRLVSRDYDDDMDQVTDRRRVTTFDSNGRFTGYIQYALSDDGQQQDVTANDVVSYPADNLVVSDRDVLPLGSPDVRIEYMVLSTAEITTSTESYFQTNGLSSITEWHYVNEPCDMRWQGAVYRESCVD